VNAETIRSMISDFIAEDPGNSIPSGPRIFDAPLVGFADASDPIFDTFRKPGIVAPWHRHPRNWLPSARSVIAYFLPITDAILDTNIPGSKPSREWMFARFWGEAVNERLRRILVHRLEDGGHQAIAPLLSPLYRVEDMNANWSERHAAFAAGLGSFGLNRGLITKRGSAGRFGSVITSLPLPATSRTQDPFSACPNLTGGSCGACIDRCPVGAISSDGKDRDRCREYLQEQQGPSVRGEWGFPYSPCGKCYVATPCSQGLSCG